MVADGHLTDVPLESVYSGVVSLRSLRLVLFLAELNGLESWATDIGNAYLEATTNEKVAIVAGPEYGHIEGHTLIIYKALYGLKLSGKMWYQRFADCLKELFQPSNADPCVWMRLNKDLDVYEYVAVYVDDLAFVVEDPNAFTKILQDKY
jgi:Reverse transcriptase (RNA-dependent DNA polymerase)